ncbi:MAG: hypothetical protein MK108_05710 [Mariniblastus sp.]|nr:hypothetical protein [Mariniblastus sp.]
MTRSPFARSPLARPSGLTLVEVLIAMTMTLVVMFAMMEAFKYASGAMQKSRAVIEMSNQLRAAQELLRSDLEQITLDPKPWTQTALPKGYFEYIEGPRRDATGSTVTTNKAQYSYLGDVDDIISFTVNRPEQPFRGRWLYLDGSSVKGKIVESPMAEIIWWTDWDDRNGNGLVDFDESVTVYRRVLLIRPDLALPPLDNAKFDPNNSWNPSVLERANTPEDRKNIFRSYCDISSRFDGTNMVANSLEDLGHRGNRYCNIVFDNSDAANGFPHQSYDYDDNGVGRTETKRFNLINSKMAANEVRSGDDIVLTNIAGFDVRVYSPNATVNEVNNLVIEPGDVLIANQTPFPSSSPHYGAFVDLAHLESSASWFGSPPHPDSGLSYPFYLNLSLTEHAYDTWTPVYEVDGFDQDDDSLIDEGTNGVNDGGKIAVDDTAERETMPPYPHPIRGLKVSLRLVEKNTKQVRQASVVHSFVPE